jgi:hypothetical protein
MLARALDEIAAAARVLRERVSGKYSTVPPRDQ